MLKKLVIVGSLIARYAGPAVLRARDISLVWEAAAFREQWFDQLSVR